MISNTSNGINRFNASLLHRFFVTIGEDLIDYADLVNFLYENKKIVSKNDILSCRNVIYLILNDFAIYFGFDLHHYNELHKIILENHTKRERITIVTPDY